MEPIRDNRKGNDALRTEYLVLVTVDGVRIQEMFGGLDVELLKQMEKGPVEESPLYKKWYAPTAKERREKIMPFFWSLMEQQGSIVGNEALGSKV